MLKLKNFKEKFLFSNREKSSYKKSSEIRSSTPIVNVVRVDEDQVKLLTEWLNELNEENLINITEQNDIVIMAGGINDQVQQIFINSNHIDHYMKTKSNRIQMSDIARILLVYGYVKEYSGQLAFTAHTIPMGTNEFKWLKSIVRDAEADPKSRQTNVRLFDGENSQIISIPYEYMFPTDDIETVVNHLFVNGHIRYNANRKRYVYRYIKPDILLDDKVKTPERLSQHQLLSFNIISIDIDQKNEHVHLGFRYETNEHLILPRRWYKHISSHHFDRDYIIDILLANGGIIYQNTFTFMGKYYSLEGPKITKSTSLTTSFNHLKTLNLSFKEKENLILKYIDLINEMDGTNIDQTNQLFVILNHIDGKRLYFTKEHSQLIRTNQFKRIFVIQILVNSSQIKFNDQQDYFLYYNNQSIRLPPAIIPSNDNSLQNKNSFYSHSNQQFSNTIQPKFSSKNLQRIKENSNQREYIERFDYIIDYMCRHGLIIWDKHSKVIRLHFSDQTLLLPIEHLNSIIDQNIFYSTNNARLPFTSRQLSQWLINNSYLTRVKH